MNMCTLHFSWCTMFQYLDRFSRFPRDLINALHLFLYDAYWFLKYCLSLFT